MEKTQHVPHDRVKPRAVRELALDVRNERVRGRLGGIKRRRRAVKQRVDLQQAPGVAIGRAAHHQAIDLGQQLKPAPQVVDPAVQYDRQGLDARA